jgi:hypothetical protein
VEAEKLSTELLERITLLMEKTVALRLLISCYSLQVSLATINNACIFQDKYSRIYPH